MLQVVVYGSVILFIGRDVFVPVAFALLISFILYPVCRWLESKGASRMTAIAIALTLLTILVSGVIALLANQLVSFFHEWPQVEGRLLSALNNFSEWAVQHFNITEAQREMFVNKIFDQAGGNLLQIARNAVTTSAFSVVMLILLPVYVVLILYYRKVWVSVLFRLFSSQQQDHVVEMLMLTIKTYYNFIKGMAAVYLIVGILNSVGLLLLGIPHAILFGFIASILTFIPYVGIIVGSLLPITMAWITYDSVWYPLGVVAIFTFVQYLEANIIFPLAVSSRLNVNTLVTLIAIFTGGILWGVAGMILFVPFLGIVKLIADHNPEWKTISLILGTKEE